MTRRFGQFGAFSLLVTFLAVGCGPSDEGGPGYSSSSGLGDSDDTGDGDGDGDGDGSGDGDGDEGQGSDEAGDPKLDVMPPDGDPEEACSKVDFLFVIDNSVSMHEKQQNLVNSFPGFIDVIQQTLAAQDYHILVADTDAHTRCTENNCANPDLFAQCVCLGQDSGGACEADYSTCDKTLGAGVIRPLGRSASNEECAIQGDQRYLTMGQPDLSDTFACMAQVGEAGKAFERPMDAMVAAVSPEINGQDGCNEGFLRDDAILVVTFISDDPNYEDTDGPQEWHDALVAAKGGNKDAIVVLGLVPEYGVCEIENIQACNISGGGNDNPQSGVHWVEFVNMFGDHGKWAHVCEDDYSPFFDDAVGVIDETCDNFDPEG